MIDFWILTGIRYFDAKTKIHLVNYIESRTDNNKSGYQSHREGDADRTGSEKIRT